MSLQLRARPFDDPDAQALIGQLQQLYTELYGGVDRDRTDPAEFAPPDGLFLVGYRDGTAVACGGWRRHDARSVEIKRMFVVPAERGRGVARELLAELEATAATAGADEVTLNTGFRQTDALAFYRAAGYLPSEDRFGHYERIEGAYFFRKAVSRGRPCRP